MTTTLPQWLQEVINLDNMELVKSLEQALIQSYQYAQNYREDPSNFIDAYQYIQSHPAFWWRDNADPDSPWYTNDYIQQVWAEHLGKASDYQWALEAGRSVEGDHTHHYHDLRLDVYGIPLEQAYVNLANKVNQVFYDNGVEKENIEHLDPPLLKEIRQRMEDWEEQKKKEAEEENTED